MARVPITISTTQETKEAFINHTTNREIPFSVWASKILKDAIRKEIKEEMIEEAETKKLLGAS